MAVPGTNRGMNELLNNRLGGIGRQMITADSGRHFRGTDQEHRSVLAKRSKTATRSPAPSGSKRSSLPDRQDLRPGGTASARSGALASCKARVGGTAASFVCLPVYHGNCYDSGSISAPALFTIKMPIARRWNQTKVVERLLTRHPLCCIARRVRFSWTAMDE